MVVGDGVGRRLERPDRAHAVTEVTLQAVLRDPIPEGGRTALSNGLPFTRLVCCLGTVAQDRDHRREAPDHRIRKSLQGFAVPGVGVRLIGKVDQTRRLGERDGCFLDQPRQRIALTAAVLERVPWPARAVRPASSRFQWPRGKASRKLAPNDADAIVVAQHETTWQASRQHVACCEATTCS